MFLIIWSAVVQIWKSSSWTSWPLVATCLEMPTHRFRIKMMYNYIWLLWHVHQGFPQIQYCVLNWLYSLIFTMFALNLNTLPPPPPPHTHTHVCSRVDWHEQGSAGAAVVCALVILSLSHAPHTAAFLVRGPDSPKSRGAQASALHPIKQAF